MVELSATGPAEVHCSSFSASPRRHFLLSSVFLPNTTLTNGSAVLPLLLSRLHMSASTPSLHLALSNPRTLPVLSEVQGQSLRPCAQPPPLSTQLPPLWSGVFAVSHLSVYLLFLCLLVPASMPSILNLPSADAADILSATALGPAGLWNRPLPEPCNSLGHQSHFPLFFLTLLWYLSSSHSLAPEPSITLILIAKG